MLKQAMVIFLCFGFMMNLGGCTSKKATEETTADVAEVSEDGVAPEGEDNVAADEKLDDLGGDELSPDEQLPPDDHATDIAEGGTQQPDEFAAQPDGLENKPSEEKPAEEPAPPAEPVPEPVPPPSTIGDLGGESMGDGMAAEETKKSPLPLRKVVDTPYEQGGVIVNTVYLARKDDTLDSISTKIYGSADHTQDLVKVNPSLKKRDVKVGDKVYYNSPHRPTDKEKMLTYYEDMGLAPETYIVNKPENVRDVAQKLLGDSRSWKELWSTNPDLESKGVLAEGTQLRYWTGMMAAPPVAKAEVPPPPPQQQDMGEVPPPPPAPNMEGTGTSPAPADQKLAEGAPPTTGVGETQAMEPPPPPPPPPHEEVAPPPPPPAEATTQHAAAEGESSPLLGWLDNPDQTMVMGAAAIILLGGVALFIVIRKRRARRNIDFHTATQTQIE